MSAEQVVRAALIKQMFAFSYSELSFHLVDSNQLRGFCRLSPSSKAPTKSTLQSNIGSIRAETWELVNQAIVLHARGCKVEDGRWMRTDTTVVESNIHSPLDSALLWDSVRVLTRIMMRAHETHGTTFFDPAVLGERDGLRWQSEAGSYRLRRVRLPCDVERGYYYGLSNEGIWPLCHNAYTAPFFRHGDWDMYRRANRIFADAVLEEIGNEPSVVFIQDYHLALLPRMIREARPDALLAQFWHIPWPNREVMRVLPWLDEFLDGLLANDLLGFHVLHHCNHFLETVDRSVEALVDYEFRRVRYGQRPAYVRPFPISIDAQTYGEFATRAPFETAFPELAGATRDQLLLLGVDRLDYTKGIPHRLRIFETLLDRHPEFRGRTTFVQIGAPTRTAIPRYAAIAKEISELVVQINAKFSRGDDWIPVRYLDQHHDRDLLAILYRRADACLVTSLHDGMNLVAKEYVAAHGGTAGTLLLSKFTGAARELAEACLINPYDIEGSAEVLAESLRLPEKTRAEAMRRLHERVCAHDVYDWAREILAQLDEVARRGTARQFPGN